jgi:hypothetical protein
VNGSGRAVKPFYARLNQLLREHGFDNFAEAQCATFYAETMGRPSLPRLLPSVVDSYFERIDSERAKKESLISLRRTVV